MRGQGLVGALLCVGVARAASGDCLKFTVTSTAPATTPWYVRTIDSIPSQHPFSQYGVCGMTMKRAPTDDNVKFDPAHKWSRSGSTKLDGESCKTASDANVGFQFFAPDFPRRGSPNTGGEVSEAEVISFVEDSTGSGYLVLTHDRHGNTDGGRLVFSVTLAGAAAAGAGYVEPFQASAPLPECNSQWETSDLPCKKWTGLTGQFVSVWSGGDATGLIIGPFAASGEWTATIVYKVTTGVKAFHVLDLEDTPYPRLGFADWTVAAESSMAKTPGQVSPVTVSLERKATGSLQCSDVCSTFTACDACGRNPACCWSGGTCSAKSEKDATRSCDVSCTASDTYTPTAAPVADQFSLAPTAAPTAMPSSGPTSSVTAPPTPSGAAPGGGVWCMHELNQDYDEMLDIILANNQEVSTQVGLGNGTAELHIVEGEAFNVFMPLPLSYSWPDKALVLTAGATAVGKGVVQITVPATDDWNIAEMELRINGLRHAHAGDLQIMITPPSATGSFTLLLRGDETNSCADDHFAGIYFCAVGCDSDPMFSQFSTPEAYQRYVLEGSPAFGGDYVFSSHSGSTMGCDAVAISTRKIAAPMLRKYTDKAAAGNWFISIGDRVPYADIGYFDSISLVITPVEGEGPPVEYFPSFAPAAALEYNKDALPAVMVPEAATSGTDPAFRGWGMGAMKDVVKAKAASTAATSGLLEQAEAALAWEAPSLIMDGTGITNAEGFLQVHLQKNLGGTVTATDPVGCVAPWVANLKVVSISKTDLFGSGTTFGTTTVPQPTIGDAFDTGFKVTFNGGSALFTDALTASDFNIVLWYEMTHKKGTAVPAANKMLRRLPIHIDPMSTEYSFSGVLPYGSKFIVYTQVVKHAKHAGVMSVASDVGYTCVQHCEKCTDSTTCQQCKDDYYLDANSLCSELDIDNAEGLTGRINNQNYGSCGNNQYATFVPDLGDAVISPTTTNTLPGTGGCNCTICRSCPRGEERTSCGGLSPGACNTCSAAKFKDKVGIATDLCTECTVCPANEYAKAPCSAASDAACSACPTNAVSLEGSLSLSGCKCKKGYYMTFKGECEKCDGWPFCEKCTETMCLKCNAEPMSATSGVVCEPEELKAGGRCAITETRNAAGEKTAIDTYPTTPNRIERKSRLYLNQCIKTCETHDAFAVLTNPSNSRSGLRCKLCEACSAGLERGFGGGQCFDDGSITGTQLTKPRAGFGQGQEPCVSCETGKFKAIVGDYKTICIPCTDCVYGEYIEDRCTAQNDNTCLPCETCGTGEARQACHNATTSEGYCIGCAVGKYKDLPGMVGATPAIDAGPGGIPPETPADPGRYEPGLWQDICEPCTECGEEMWTASKCSSTRDTGECYACTKPTNGTYITVQCAETANTILGACPNCPVGQFNAGCGDDNEGVCSPCGEGMYKDTVVYRGYCDTMKTCVTDPADPQKEHKFIKVIGDRTRDTTCTACEDFGDWGMGYFIVEQFDGCDDINASVATSTLNPDGQCRPLPLAENSIFFPDDGTKYYKMRLQPSGSSIQLSYFRDIVCLDSISAVTNETMALDQCAVGVTGRSIKLDLDAGASPSIVTRTVWGMGSKCVMLNPPFARLL